MRETIKLYKGKVVVSFEEKDRGGNKVHIYEVNGEKKLSVTQITSIIDKSNILINWAINLMGKYLLDNLSEKVIDSYSIEIAKTKWREAKEEAADIGLIIHNWIDEYIKGLKPKLPDDNRAKNGVFAFLKWQNENKIKWVESERVVYSMKYDYVGRLDAIVKIKGKNYLVDYKSSKGLYPEFYLQTAAYQLAYQEETGKKIDGRILIRLGKDDGVFEAKKIDGFEKDKKAFLGLLEVKKRLLEIERSKEVAYGNLIETGKRSKIKKFG